MLLTSLLEKKERVVAGLMSGTSLDGIDVVVARIAGSGPGLRPEVLGSFHEPYSPALRERLLKISDPATSSVRELSQLNALLGQLYARAVLRAMEEAGLPPTALDLVGSHGQTVHHVPEAEEIEGLAVISTLQIGDPSVLANRLGVPVVGDFRTADMALGGQGAPLVPYFDFVCFASPEETRGLLNLGGIGNVTVLPRGGAAADVYAFDTGPGNMVMDALAARLFDRPYDPGGRFAAQGRVSEPLLAHLMADAYFAQRPPKSTGRERYGAAFVEGLLAWGNGAPGGALSPEDLLATSTALTARAVAAAYERFIRPTHPLDVLIVSGGGMHNRFLMQRLADDLAPVRVRPISDYGVDPDAKEALCFAVLAHETLNGVPTNLPAVTGASRPTLLGKICLPGPGTGEE